MRKVKSLLKQTSPLQICSASFLNSPEHKKPTNILTKNTLQISLFTDCSLQIKFLPFLKSWPATIYWGKKDDKLGNKTRLRIERKIEIYICKSISKFWLTTVFVDTRLSKTKHPRKRFQNFRQSCMLSTDRIEIHQSQPLV